MVLAHQVEPQRHRDQRLALPLHPLAVDEPRALPDAQLLVAQVPDVVAHRGAAGTGVWRLAQRHQHLEVLRGLVEREGGHRGLSGSAWLHRYEAVLRRIDVETERILRDRQDEPSHLERDRRPDPARPHLDVLAAALQVLHHVRGLVAVVGQQPEVVSRLYLAGETRHLGRRDDDVDGQVGRPASERQPVAGAQPSHALRGRTGRRLHRQLNDDRLHRHTPSALQTENLRSVPRAAPARRRQRSTDPPSSRARETSSETHSMVRRLAFGPEDQFVRYLGHYFAFANAEPALGEHRWMTLYNAPGRMAGVYRPGNHAGSKVNFRAPERGSVSSARTASPGRPSIAQAPESSP